jgi:VWFA-related protein
LQVRTRDGYRAPMPPPVRPVLEFTVTDAQQRYVDVTADDLLVLEDGIEQRVDSFQEAVTPVSIVLALDASGSMRKSAGEVTEAAREFVEAVRPQDSLAVVMFADKSLFAHDLTTNRDSAQEAISSYQSAGGTALYDSLKDALIRLRRVEGRRAVVVVTDGRDENSTASGPGSVATFDQVVDLTRQTGAAVYSIGLGSRVDRESLARLSQLSGGQSYFPAEVSSLREDYRRVVENLRRRFMLSFTSTNSHRDGSWRAVSIRARNAAFIVNSPSGYFAPER